MGRWAQRKRRGGDAEPPPAPALVNIASIAFGPTDYTVIFDGPVSIDTMAVPDGGLTLDGNNVDTVTVINPNAVAVTTGGFMSGGQPWSLTSQPAWCLTSLAFPASGTT